MEGIDPLTGLPPTKKMRGPTAKTFQCRGYGECRMVFSRSEHLARHVRKHTGERPFKCHCGKSFSRLDNLRQHAHTVHADRAEQNEAMMRDLGHLHTTLSFTTVQRSIFANPTMDAMDPDTSGSGDSPNGHGASDANLIKLEEEDNISPLGYARNGQYRHSHARPDTSAGYEVNYAADHGGDYFPEPAQAHHWPPPNGGGDTSFRTAAHNPYIGAPSSNAAGASPAGSGGNSFPRSGHSFRLPLHPLPSVPEHRFRGGSPLGQHEQLQQRRDERGPPSRSGPAELPLHLQQQQQHEHALQPAGVPSLPPASSLPNPRDRETLPPVSLLLDSAPLPPPGSRPGTAGVHAGFGSSYLGGLPDHHHQPGGAAALRVPEYGSPPDTAGPPWVSQVDRPDTAPANSGSFPERRLPFSSPSSTLQTPLRRFPAHLASNGYGAGPPATAAPPGLYAEPRLGGGRPGTGGGVSSGPRGRAADVGGARADDALLFPAPERSAFGSHPQHVSQQFDQYYADGHGGLGADRELQQPPSPGHDPFAFHPPGLGGGSTGVLTRPNTGHVSRPGTSTRLPGLGQAGAAGGPFAFAPPPLPAPPPPAGSDFLGKRPYPFSRDGDVHDAPPHRLARPFTSGPGFVRRGGYSFGGPARPSTGYVASGPPSAVSPSHDGVWSSAAGRGGGGGGATAFAIPPSAGGVAPADGVHAAAAPAHDGARHATRNGVSNERRGDEFGQDGHGRYAEPEREHAYGLQREADGSDHVPAPADSPRPTSRRLTLMDLLSPGSPVPLRPAAAGASPYARAPEHGPADASRGSAGVVEPSEPLSDSDASAASSEEAATSADDRSPAAAFSGSPSAASPGYHTRASPIPPARRLPAIAHLLASPSPQLAAVSAARGVPAPSLAHLGIGGYARAPRSQSASPSRSAGQQHAPAWDGRPPSATGVTAGL